jgi:hypothetical protein
MPNWAGSSWYYLRYIDPKNDEKFVNKELEKEWSPVDFYVGGAEHATRHLIYARFWHKFLFDKGLVNYDEPFSKLQTVGLIMAEDGKKMSKRYGNVVNSKGSIVPLLQEQLKNPGFNLTLTDPRMTRFMMTMEESVELIIQSIYSGSSGDIWIPRLDSMSMSDLFQWFSNKHNRKVEITGIRPGEKIHEVLYNQDESRYIQEFSRGSRAPYYVINKTKLSDTKGFKLHEFSSEHNVISPEVLGKRLEEFFKSGSYLR